VAPVTAADLALAGWTSRQVTLAADESFSRLAPGQARLCLLAPPVNAFPPPEKLLGSHIVVLDSGPFHFRSGHDEPDTAPRPSSEGQQTPPPLRGSDESGNTPPAPEPVEPAPLPQLAEMLRGGPPAGLAALERAVQALTEADASAGDRIPILLRWLGVATWLAGAAVLYLVARRRRAAGIALSESAPAECEEELP
jgi:hypothetical protein